MQVHTTLLMTISRLVQQCAMLQEASPCTLAPEAGALHTEQSLATLTPYLKGPSGIGQTPVSHPSSTTSEIPAAAGGALDTPATPPLSAAATPDDAHFTRLLEQQFLADLERRAQQRAEADAIPFSLHDIVNNPALAHAAWRELAAQGASVSPEEPQGQRSFSVAIAPAATASRTLPRRTLSGAHCRCAPELHRAVEFVDAIVTGTDAESKLNQEMASLLLSRLNAGRQSLEASLCFVQVWHMVSDTQ
jgi:hypothetical protein